MSGLTCSKWDVGSFSCDMNSYGIQHAGSHSLTGDGTQAAYIGSLSHWTTRENPTHFKKFLDIKCLSLHYDFTLWVCTRCCVTVHSLSRVWLFVTPWTIARQAPLSMGFPRQEYWSGLPFFSPGDLPDPGVEPMFPALAGGYFTIWATREAQLCTWGRCIGGKWARKLSSVKFWFSWCGILNPLLYLASGWKWKWVAQSCPTICDPMDCNPPGSFVHGILQARILEWVAICSSRGPSWPRDQTCIFCNSRQILHHLSHQGSPQSISAKSKLPSTSPTSISWCHWEHNRPSFSLSVSFAYTSNSIRRILISNEKSAHYLPVLWGKEVTPH